MDKEVTLKVNREKNKSPKEGTSTFLKYVIYSFIIPFSYVGWFSQTFIIPYFFGARHISVLDSAPPLFSWEALHQWPVFSWFLFSHLQHGLQCLSRLLWGLNPIEYARYLFLPAPWAASLLVELYGKLWWIVHPEVYKVSFAEEWETQGMCLVGSRVAHKIKASSRKIWSSFLPMTSCISCRSFV